MMHCGIGRADLEGFATGEKPCASVRVEYQVDVANAWQVAARGYVRAHELHGVVARHELVDRNVDDEGEPALRAGITDLVLLGLTVVGPAVKNRASAAESLCSSQLLPFKRARIAYWSRGPCVKSSSRPRTS